MSNSIAGAFVTLLFILAVWFGATTISGAAGTSNSADREAAAVRTVRRNSLIAISSASIAAAGSTITVTVDNLGEIPIVPSRIDAYLLYTAINQTRVAQPSSFTLSTIQPDNRNPGMLDRGEQATLVFTVIPPVGINKYATVTLVTPDGTTDARTAQNP